MTINHRDEKKKFPLVKFTIMYSSIIFFQPSGEKIECFSTSVLFHID